MHNLIEFGNNELENTLWRVVQTSPFQRLRRIKQLGFSDLVYPGATHSRFAHCIGTFHTARRLMEIIRAHLGHDFQETKAQQALAAALVHDLGHGPFSHAFEQVGARLNIKMANHEMVSEALIKEGSVRDELQALGSGFADDVANVIHSGPETIYQAVVSSQFDADRLDYMRRDRLMTGTQHGVIDFDWLIANLEIGTVPSGVDDEELGGKETFVLGPKAIHAAEAYILGLFQLYPTVYFHKATRGAEKIFTELLARIILLVSDGSLKNTGLPAKHPIVQFAKKPASVELVQSLDDAVIWGALPLLGEAKDPAVANLADRLGNRHFYKCVDIGQQIRGRTLPPLTNAKDQAIASRVARIRNRDLKSSFDIAQQIREMAEEIREVEKDRFDSICKSIRQKVGDWVDRDKSNLPRIVLDETDRTPYKKLSESKGPLNQIRIRMSDDSQKDIRECSPVVRSIPTFKLFRAYFDADDMEARNYVNDVIREEMANA